MGAEGSTFGPVIRVGGRGKKVARWRAAFGSRGKVIGHVWQCSVSRYRRCVTWFLEYSWKISERKGRLLGLLSVLVEEEKKSPGGGLRSCRGRVTGKDARGCLGEAVRTSAVTGFV